MFEPLFHTMSIPSLGKFALMVSPALVLAHYFQAFHVCLDLPFVVDLFVCFRSRVFAWRHRSVADRCVDGLCICIFRLELNSPESLPPGLAEIGHL
jgi:uncharacterized membrane protein YGL010W